MHFFSLEMRFLDKTSIPVEDWLKTRIKKELRFGEKVPDFIRQAGLEFALGLLEEYEFDSRH